jgi:septum formation protein
MNPPRILLASASPRRRELLAQIGIAFDLLAVAADEIPRRDETPPQYVQRVAAEKSWLAQQATSTDLPVLGADTEVILDGEVFGKPRDFAHARDMLKRLSGREHEVLSGVSLRHGNRHWQILSRSAVTFRPLAEAEIAAYWASGEPRDKAGAYAIQGLGAVFVERLSGSFSGVMGLPVFETAQLLRAAGIEVLGASPPLA